MNTHPILSHVRAFSNRHIQAGAAIPIVRCVESYLKTARLNTDSTSLSFHSLLCHQLCQLASLIDSKPCQNTATVDDPCHSAPDTNTVHELLTLASPFKCEVLADASPRGTPMAEPISAAAGAAGFVGLLDVGLAGRAKSSTPSSAVSEVPQERSRYCRQS